jgi:hypothetical protein
MTTKFSQLPVTTNLATPANILFAIVDTSGPTSFTTALTTLSAQILSGNSATATKLQTARTINGVSFDGTANISITASIPTASASVLGGIKVGSNLSIDPVTGVLSAGNSYVLPTATASVLGGVVVGSGINVAIDGTISVATINVATTSVAGTVIVGNGLQVKNDGTVSTTTTPAFHGFVVNANGDLEYTRMTSGDLAVANGDATEQYVMWEIGSSDYSWKITANGNLEIEYTDSDI